MAGARFPDRSRVLFLYYNILYELCQIKIAYGVPIGPPGAFGKIRTHMKVARSRENFAYGVCDRENGPCLPSAAR